MLVTCARTAAAEQWKIMEAAPKSGASAGTVTLTERWREYRSLSWETRSRVLVLVVRVRDEEVREMVRELLGHTDYLGKADPWTWNLTHELSKQGEDVGPDPELEAPDVLRLVNRHIGELIRAEQSQPE